GAVPACRRGRSQETRAPRRPDDPRRDPAVHPRLRCPRGAHRDPPRALHRDDGPPPRPFQPRSAVGLRPRGEGLTTTTDGIDMAEFTFAPLTPASFLDRAAAVFADRTAIVDGERRFTYRDLSGRCRRLAGALAALGLGH